MSSWVVRFVAPWLLAAVAASVATAAPVSEPSPVAVLPFLSVTEDEYSVAPTRDEVASVTLQVRRGLASAPPHFTVLPQSRVTSDRCGDAECARRIGRALGAHVVVFGSVVRFAGIRWNTEVSAVDVRSGRLVDRLTYGVFGDYDSLLNAVREVGACLAQSIAGAAHCKARPPAI
ncbi:MAG TPA: DUF2380 domain-containing protein [Candidatus Limnocylindria bacterium]|nr:DUF2380 domain-containing protein [Candidatus Limnocylindria bacterium]